MRNQKGSTLIIIGIVAAILIVSTFYLFNINQRKSGLEQVGKNAEVTNKKSVSYKRSVGLKGLVSDKYKFRLSYPDQWSYYPKQQYIDTNFILFPEFNGTTVEINVVKNSDFNSVQKFNAEPLALKIALSQGYKASDFSTSGGQAARMFEGIAADDYLSSNNLHGTYDVKVVQFRGNDYTYVITTVYFLNEYTSQFLSELDNLLKSFSII